MVESQPDPEQPGYSLQTDRLIQTKLLFPRIQSNWVERPRLVEKLDQGLNRTLTLISAPAGFGKTSLLSEWIRKSAGRHIPVAWLALDERDNDPQRFGWYLSEAFAGIGIHLNQEKPSGSEDTTQLLEDLLVRLVNHLTGLNQNMVLILDDYHSISSQAIHSALLFFLDHLPPDIHLLIASRADPPFQLSQFRARGQLLELRTNDLRFTFSESRAFLNQQMGLNLSNEDVRSLEASTEGWIAGLQLAALAMRECDDNPGFIQSFTGSHRYIVDYLAEQVLLQQPGEVQSFLLQTSILERLNSSLCAEVTGRQDSQMVLEWLERENLFLVRLDEQRVWYRYHTLFGEFLRGYLRRSQPGQLPELYRKATAWYERNGYNAEAVDLALAVGDSQLALRLIEQVAEDIWMRGEMVRLLGWLQALPLDLIRSHPNLCIFHAWISNITGEFERVEARLRDVEEFLKLDSQEPDSARQLTRGMHAATRAIINLMDGDTASAIERSHFALAVLPETNRAWRSVVIRNLGNAYLLNGQTQEAYQAFVEAYHTSLEAGSIYLALIALYELGELLIVQGRLHQAAHTFQNGLNLAAEQGSSGLTITGALYAGLSEVLREWNQLEQGIRAAQIAIELGRRGRSVGIQVCGYTRLALLARALGDDATETLAYGKAAHFASSYRRTSFIAHHDIQARLTSNKFGFSSAPAFSENSRDPQDQLDYLGEIGSIEQARFLLAQNRLDEAGSLLSRLHEVTASAGRTGRLIEILVLQTLVSSEVGDLDKAMEFLDRAISLAEPEGYLRIFLDEGPALAALLASISVDHPRKKYIEKILALLPGSQQVTKDNLPPVYPEPVQDNNLVKPLSNQELEVLERIAAGLSNKQAAEELFVAPSTIHTHIKNIFRKLNVHSRTQAIARARDMGMLPKDERRRSRVRHYSNL